MSVGLEKDREREKILFLTESRGESRREEIQFRQIGLMTIFRSHLSDGGGGGGGGGGRGGGGGGERRRRRRRRRKKRKVHFAPRPLSLFSFFPAGEGVRMIVFNLSKGRSEHGGLKGLFCLLVSVLCTVDGQQQQPSYRSIAAKLQ